MRSLILTFILACASIKSVILIWRSGVDRESQDQTFCKQQISVVNDEDEIGKAEGKD